jgi:hypothetical protein
VSDQKKWFKVWSTILIDNAHTNLSLEDVGRWVRLGAMMVSVGEAGKLKITPPAKALLTAMEVTTIHAAKCAILRLPNVHISDTGEESKSDNVSFTVTFKNWHKYQVDSTVYERVKRLRIKRRGEEKRREKKRILKPTALSAAHFSSENLKKNDPIQVWTQVQKVVLSFKEITGVDLQDKEWDKVYFPRYTKPAKQLLDLLGDDWERCWKCIRDVASWLESKNLSWTPETIVKHAQEWKMNKLEKLKT